MKKSKSPTLSRVKAKNHRKVLQKLKHKLKNSINEKPIVKKIIKANFKRIGLKKVKAKKNNHYDPVIYIFAPVAIDYYNKTNFEKTCKFISQIRKKSRRDKRLFINFDNTQIISAAAMLSFLAEVDQILNSSKNKVSINFSHPQNEKTESILVQVGFYDIVGKPKRQPMEFDDVNYWKFASGFCSEPIIVKPMLQEIKKELELRSSKRLYRGFVEAMSNSVEHAYPESMIEEDSNKNSRWWAFAGIKDDVLLVVICDKGVGIPRTLPHNHGPSFVQNLIESLGFSSRKVKDSVFIKAATLIEKTKTGEAHRGKGLSDMQSVIDTVHKGLLSIYSNKGLYRYTGSTGAVSDLMTDNKSSVNGTIVEWKLPLNEKGK